VRGHPANAGGTRTAYVVAETKSGAPFRLRRARFKGKGPQFEDDVPLLKTFIKPTDICWDIGANSGTYTVPLSRLEN
jgi:hypothetical protein